MTLESNSAKLGSVRTEILVGWIFALLVLISWVIIILIYLALTVSLLISLSSLGIASLAFLLYLWPLILLLVLLILTVLVFSHVNRMRSAANRGDISQLKQLNSVGWGVVALIFSGLIVGIMLLIAHRPIMELTLEETGGGMTTDAVDRLVKLKSLQDSGVITKEEFEAQKSAILHPQITQSASAEDGLKKLKALHDSGAITDGEYESQKNKILSKM